MQFLNAEFYTLSTDQVQFIDNGDASEMILTSTLITDVESELVIKGYNTGTDDQTNIDINLVTSQNLTNILLSASGIH